jgi:predicted GH43/DUF377 family glycosyl hydrolase
MTPSTHPTQVPDAEMQTIFEETKTPHKYGIVIHPPEGGVVDCPSIFRRNNRWYMMYVAAQNKIGYETLLAESENLLDWKPLGKILSFQNDGWDQWQADGGIALVDHTWAGSSALQTHDNKYWLSYIGGALQGYEPDPLSVGLAWTQTPDQPTEWTRLPNNPVLAPSDPDVRPFEKKTLYKSNIIRDDSKSLGSEFVMFYNGKQEGPGTERIGMALSDNMLHWKRFGQNPVIDNGPRGISGDPQIVRIKNLWVMFYFGHVWQPKAFDTFACSYDLVNWTKWTGPHLIEPTEPWDSTFAHKPWLLKWEGVVYHYYCAVGNQGRTIALATSRNLCPT